MTHNEEAGRAHRFAQGLATLMGVGWSYTPTCWGDEPRLTHWAELRHRDGHGISLAMGDKGRLVISGVWPKTADGKDVRPHQGCQGWPRPTAVTITVSPDRPLIEIRKEIDRRFLPAYLKQYAECAAYARQNDQADTDRAAAKARLARFPAVRFPTRSDGGYADCGTLSFADNRYGDVQVSGANSITLKLNGLSVEQAEAVLRALGCGR